MRRKTPGRVLCAPNWNRVDATILRAKIDHVTGEGGRRRDVASRGERPDELSVRDPQFPHFLVIGADKDSVAAHRRRGIDLAAGRVLPDLAAVNGSERVDIVIVRADRKSVV